MRHIVVLTTLFLSSATLTIILSSENKNTILQNTYSTSKSREYLDNHAILTDQSLLIQQLTKNKIIHPDRFLSHLSHVCTLSLRGQQFPIVDLQELIKGANSTRGFNRIIVLNNNLKMINSIEYINNRPLFCRNNKLFIYGSLSLDGIPDEGNVLTFDANGNIIDFQLIDVQEWF